jgi:hypothetical protein
MHLDMCLDIASFAKFQIFHIPRHENYKANMLAQQASGFGIGGRKFHMKEKSMQEHSLVLCVGAVELAQLTLPWPAQPLRLRSSQIGLT